MGCYWRDLGPGGHRTQDRAQKRELYIEETWWGAGAVILTKRVEGRGNQRTWRTTDIVHMLRLPTSSVLAVQCVQSGLGVELCASHLSFCFFLFGGDKPDMPLIFPVWSLGVHVC